MWWSYLFGISYYSFRRRQCAISKLPLDTPMPTHSSSTVVWNDIDWLRYHSRSDPIRLKEAPSTKDEQIINDRYIVKKAKPEMITLEDVSTVVKGVRYRSILSGVGHLSEARAETIARKNSLQFANSLTLSDRQENMPNREVWDIQDKKTGETPPNTPPPTSPPIKSPGGRERKKPPYV